jgi:hypothetical protein
MSLISIFFPALLHAQQAIVTQADLACRIEGFKAAKTEVCKSLADRKDVKVGSIEDCKQRALKLGGDCLGGPGKASKQISIHGKFTQKAGVTQESTSFICQMDSSGGSACP